MTSQRGDAPSSDAEELVRARVRGGKPVPSVPKLSACDDITIGVANTSPVDEVSSETNRDGRVPRNTVDVVERSVTNTGLHIASQLEAARGLEYGLRPSLPRDA